MLNLLKWNALDFLHRYYWIFILALTALVIGIVTPNGMGAGNALLIDLAMLLSFLFFQAAAVLAAYQCIGWLRRDSALFELSVPIPAWKLLFGKVIIAGIINFLASLEVVQLMLLFGKYSSGVVSPLTLGQLGTVLGIVIFMTMVDMTILFSYMVARSFRFFRLQAALFTTIFSIILLTLIFIFCAGLMLMTNLLILPTFSTQHVITVNGTLQIISFLPPLWICGFVIVLGFLGSSLLLKTRIQVD